MRTTGEIDDWVHANLHKLFPRVAHVDKPPMYIVQDDAVWVFVQVIGTDEPGYSFTGHPFEDVMIDLTSLVFMGLERAEAEEVMEEIKEDGSVGWFSLQVNSRDEEKVDIVLKNFHSAAVGEGGNLTRTIKEMIVATDRLHKEWYEPA